jgi:hypothetical protein
VESAKKNCRKEGTTKEESQNVLARRVKRRKLRGKGVEKSDGSKGKNGRIEDREETFWD